MSGLCLLDIVGLIALETLNPIAYVHSLLEGVAKERIYGTIQL